MKNSKHIFFVLLTTIILGVSTHKLLTSTTYTQSDVSQHNTSTSCWVIYDGNVYDITTYLNIHNQRYQNITSWCGTDITTDFHNVRKHTTSARTLLAGFQVGTLSTNSTNDTTVSTNKDETATTTMTSTNNSPYNLLLPLLLGFATYGITYIYIFKVKGDKPQWANIKNFNALWNTILLLTFLIPTFGFGVIMVLQYQYPLFLADDFNFLYWHVELALFMGAIGVSHFLQRSKAYLMEIKRR